MSGKTVWSCNSTIIESAHRLMTTVPGELDRIIFYDILLDDGVSVCPIHLCLINCLIVEIALWNVAIVAWNVSSYLSSALIQLMHFILHLNGVVRQLIAWVLSKFTKTLVILSIKEGATRRVCLTRKAPQWS